MSDLKVDVSQQSKSVSFTVKGKLIEGSSFPDLALSMDSKLSINWNGLTYINSVGLKIWVEYLAKLTKKIPASNITYTHCPPIFVDQMSKVKNVIVKGVSVISFYSPYVCLNCGHTQNVLFEFGKHFKAKGNGFEVNSNKIICEKCLKDMELDTTPAKYFNFLSLI